MSIKVRIPAQLRSLTGGEGELAFEGAATVGEVLSKLVASYPELGERIMGEDGKPRRFVNLFVADEDIRFLEGLETAVAEGDVVSVVPAIAGG